MKITDIGVHAFRYTLRQVRDSDGHTHPGDPHEARQALLTIEAEQHSGGTGKHRLSYEQIPVRRHALRIRRVKVRRVVEPIAVG